jgi:lysophospholipase L1-like esterase
VPQLLGRLPPGTQLVNLGVSGTVLSTALADQVPAAVAAAPDLVTVWLAVNDFNARVPLAQYIADLDALLGTLREGTAAVIAVGNVPDLSLVPAYGGNNPALLRTEVGRWNAAIADVVGRRGALLVDLASRWTELAAHPEYVSSDGFHPGNEGYRRLADLFWEVLAPAVPGGAP